MALRKPEHLDAIMQRHPGCPAVFLESGTFHGKTTRWAVERFRQVRTIELHPLWHAEADRDMGPLGVRCYHGNSAEWVPILAAEISEPVCWYLDAHFFHRKVKDVAGKAEGLPLWDELSAIADRPFADIVIVDDVHCFGTDQPTPEWLDVSLEKIASFFPGHREAVIMNDQAVVYK